MIKHYSIILLFGLIAVLFPVGLVAAQGSFIDPNDQAIADWTQVITKNLNDATAYLKRGKAYENKVQYDLAIQDLTKAIEINPNYAAAYLERGYIYCFKKGQDDLAFDDYNKAITCDSRYAYAYNDRGYIYIKRVQYDLWRF